MKFPVIVADHPWHFAAYSEETGIDRGAVQHYDIMTLQDIKEMPVDAVAADDCVLCLWATWPLLPEAIEVGREYGFTYKTCAFNWVKLNKNQTEKPFTGLGYWTRANSEPCLLFTKGNPSRINMDVEQMIVDWEGGLFNWDDFETETVATPIGRHSAKPDAIYQRVERLVQGPYLELFARKRRKGWTSLGNQIDGLDINVALRRLAAEGSLTGEGVR